jgi:hypothetical protein
VDANEVGADMVADGLERAVEAEEWSDGDNGDNKDNGNE